MRQPTWTNIWVIDPSFSFQGFSTPGHSVQWGIEIVRGLVGGKREWWKKWEEGSLGGNWQEVIQEVKFNYKVAFLEQRGWFCHEECGRMHMHYQCCFYTISPYPPLYTTASSSFFSWPVAMWSWLVVKGICHWVEGKICWEDTSFPMFHFSKNTTITEMIIPSVLERRYCRDLWTFKLMASRIYFFGLKGHLLWWKLILDLRREG